MDRYWIEHGGVDPAIAEHAADGVSSLRPDDELVVNVNATGGDERRRHIGRAQGVAVRCRDRAPSLVFTIEMTELHAEDRRLQLVEAAVPSTRFAHIALLPAVLAQEPDAFRDRRIAGHDHTAVADRAEVLRRIEAERRSRSKRTGAPAGDRRSVRLRAILDHHEAVSRSEARNILHRRRVAIEMHRNDRADRLACMPREPLLRVDTIHRERSRLAVRENRHGAAALARATSRGL